MVCRDISGFFWMVCLVEAILSAPFGEVGANLKQEASPWMERLFHMSPIFKDEMGNTYFGDLV